MSISQSPADWSGPTWHPDCGVPNVELEHLRSFAIQLLSRVPEAIVMLETPEPGLMLLRVQLPDGTAAEVYSVETPKQPDRRRLALFLNVDTDDETEVYADSPELAVRQFETR